MAYLNDRKCVSGRGLRINVDLGQCRRVGKQTSRPILCFQASLVIAMPNCEGRPDGKCPDKRNDATVHLSQGDLLLCEACEKFRFPQIVRRQAATTRKVETRGGSRGKNDADAESRHLSVSEDSRSTGSDHSSRQIPELTPVTANASSSTSSALAAAPGPELIVDELFYVSFYRNKCNVESLRRTVLSFYLPSVVSLSKKLLTGKFSTQLVSCSFAADRRNSATRASHEAEMDDIINIFDFLDLQGCFTNCKFVAYNLDNLPKFGPEELNLAAVVDRQLRTEATVTDMAVAIDNMKMTQVNSVTLADSDATSRQVIELQQRLEAFSSSVCARLDHLNAVCSNGLSAVAESRSQQQAIHNSEDTDRRLNIVIFGVKEERDVTLWHKSVNDILSFVSGHNVDVVDQFRLGRYVGNTDGASRKPRPILVKLRVFWDRRVILSRCSVLKQYKQAGVFIVPDESVEVRRKNMLDRLQSRALNEGKKTVVNDGVLSINDAPIFSVQAGYLNKISHG